MNLSNRMDSIFRSIFYWYLEFLVYKSYKISLATTSRESWYNRIIGVFHEFEYREKQKKYNEKAAPSGGEFVWKSPDELKKGCCSVAGRPIMRTLLQKHVFSWFPFRLVDESAYNLLLRKSYIAYSAYRYKWISQIYYQGV